MTQQEYIEKFSAITAWKVMLVYSLFNGAGFKVSARPVNDDMNTYPAILPGKVIDVVISQQEISLPDFDKDFSKAYTKMVEATLN